MKRLLLFAILVLAIAGCAPAALPPPKGEPLPPERGFVEPEEAQLGLTGDTFTELPQLEDRKIIRTATIDIVVQDTEASLAKIEALAAQLGGYVSNSESWKVEDQLLATVTIRIPSDRYQEARQRIKEEAVEPPTENQSSQDVTQEYVDLQARLKNLQLTEQELQELLEHVQETSRKAEDILAVYRELTAIRQQIEQIQGQIQYLDNLTALASITVNLTPQPAVTDTGWDPGRTVRESLREFVEALQVLADIAIRFLLTFLPLFLLLLTPLLVVAWFVRRWWLGRNKMMTSA